MRVQRSKLPLLGLLCLAALSLVGCKKSEEELQRQKAHEIAKLIKRQPGYSQWLEALSFLREMMQSRRLPGAENAEVGAMLGYPDAIHPQSTNYPMSRTFVGQKRFNGPWENHYLVVKNSPDSAWELQKAWRTDSDGKIVEEYPLAGLSESRLQIQEKP